MTLRLEGAFQSLCLFDITFRAVLLCRSFGNCISRLLFLTWEFSVLAKLRTQFSCLPFKLKIPHLVDLNINEKRTLEKTAVMVWISSYYGDNNIFR